MKASFLSRSRFLLILFVLFALVLLFRLFQVQVLKNDFYVEAANRQYATPSENIFERKTIYFKRKDGALVSAATQMPGFKLAIAPGKIKDAEAAYQKLSSVLSLNREDFFKKAERKNDPYEEIARQLLKEDADQISALKIPGVKVFKEKWRFYPGQNLAAHTLGFLGYQGDTLAGRYGLERRYNETLATSGSRAHVNFFAEVFSNINQTIFEKEAKNGDIVTTIEPTVQDFLENQLSKVHAKYNAQTVGGIVMNPKTGAIYALAAKPDFNPNDFSNTKDVAVFRNPLVENVLEFGSVVKPLILASALDAGVITAKTTYTDTGSVWVEKKEIFNFDKKGRGPGTSMQEVLGQSLNTGMVFVYQKLGKERLRNYLLSFGVAEKTGIDLPNEAGNLTKNLKSPRDIEYANASFGQGIALTPMAMIRALASLANGGYLVVPHVVEKIKYGDGTEDRKTYPTSRVQLSEAATEEITRMLVEVMDKSLRAGTKKLERHSLAVKTGTAQVADPSSGGYYLDRNLHSFFGYFPAYDPEFILLLYAVNPKGTRYASETWTDPFLNFAKFLIAYYNIPPDR